MTAEESLRRELTVKQVSFIATSLANVALARIFRLRGLNLSSPLHGAHRAQVNLSINYTTSAPVNYCHGDTYSQQQQQQQQHCQRIASRARGSASPVLTATGFVNGKPQFSTPYRIDTPQPITKKFVAGDYVGDPYSCAKFGAHPSTGTLGRMGEI